MRCRRGSAGAAKPAWQRLVAPVPVTRWNSASCVQTAPVTAFAFLKRPWPVIRDVLAKLVASERVALLREDEELSPEQAATILGISRPLVVRRMDGGRLPFRYVGAHRRCRLSDVLKLRREEEGQREALDRLASDTEGLMRDHGL